MKVFLVEPSVRYDLTTLVAYGDVSYVSDVAMNPFNTDDCLKRIKDGLKDFDPTEDFVCMTGNLLTVSLMMTIAYSLFPSFKVLIFDARHSNYKERVICHV